MNIFNLRNIILSSMYNIKQNRQSFHFPNILLSEMLLLKNNIKKYLNKIIKKGLKDIFKVIYLLLCYFKQKPCLIKNYHLRSVKYIAPFTQKLAFIMADENNNNVDGVLIPKPAGHHNQLYVLIFT